MLYGSETCEFWYSVIKLQKPLRKVYAVIDFHSGLTALEIDLPQTSKMSTFSILELANIYRRLSRKLMLTNVNEIGILLILLSCEEFSDAI